MRSKRQTVWLVSMLSLMVVLSAYYLFTEDSPAKNQAADGKQVSTMDKGMTQETVTDSGLGQDGEVILSEVVTDGEQSPVITDEEAATDPVANSGGAPDTEKTADSSDPGKDSAVKESDGKKEEAAGKDGDSSTAGNTGTGDEDVLKLLETQGVTATDSLTAYQFQRNAENMKKQDELVQAINDGSKTLEEAAMAQKELSALEEREEKIYSIEEKLQQKYANAVVEETDNKYKVLVVSEKLEAKDAVGIMDLVIKELGVSQDKVSVQYITQ
ncbi:SpoIIIAH-like family protein [Paenibacillus vini]|uniref:Mutants block sporulation after engulfment (Stage III sporulation) n=1 Tax=Paenibacillus vini TaxID=1476024 RepID=A0ABQ4M7P2_9BACL|nr:SpoIIIAH-like family protein [Paenibacillus vini]GIP51995.1 hypothetical protein J42TS3_10300 [Paenibacillus vini]